MDSFAKANKLSAITLNVAVFNLGDRQYFDWSDVRGRPATDLGILRFSRPGRSVNAALNFNW